MKNETALALPMLLQDWLKGTGAFFGIFLLIQVLFFFSLNFSGTSANSVTTNTSITFACIIFFFVVGIAGVRSDIRLCSQFGIGRRSAFIAEIAVALIIALLLSAAGELLNGLGSLLVSSFPDQHLINWSFMYLFYPGSTFSSDFLGHLFSMLFNFLLMIAAFAFGLFFTLLFWRLRGLWIAIAAISIPVFLNVIPMLGYYVGINKFLIPWCGESPIHTMLLALLFTAVCLLISWLLLRKAYIRGAAK